MSTLPEIEAAVRLLSAEQKQDLLLLLADQLRAERKAQVPAVRRFEKSQIDGWIAEDEADAKRFRETA